MLIYHPAFDAYHCTFQLLSIVQPGKNYEVQKVQILDFCISFPTVILQFRLPQKLSAKRALVKKQANPYRDPKTHKLLFLEIQKIQVSAMNGLAAAGLLDVKALNSGWVLRTDKPLSAALSSRVSKHLEEESELMSFILNDLAAIPLAGVDGLKDRSGLLEYRYDVV